MSEDDDRDHRKIGKKLDLFSFREEAPGMVFWHPRGYALYRVLEQAVRDQARAQGYLEVRTPQILRRATWEASGHWAHFRENMFRVEDQAMEAAVKPVSCPGHLYVALQRVPSYRDLPLRFSELGLVHRDEASGTLHGLLRVRQFTQDDGHVICGFDRVEDELDRFCRGLRPFYRAFGFDELRVSLSLRPASRAGDDALWDRAEDTLRRGLSRAGLAYDEQPGQGAFYGPKIEIGLRDRHGRDWQCGTVQLDAFMPERFGLRYVDADGDRKAPVMLHRALYGSLERFFGMLLEHHGPRLPAWLAPVQVVVLPVSEAQSADAREWVETLENAGIRALSLHGESLARRVVDAHALSSPFVVVLGAREVAQGQVTFRGDAGARELVLPRDEAVRHVLRAVARPALT